MLANNIANTGTTGFKADREFYNVYQRQLPLIENRWTDFSQGSLVPTGNSLDLALTGPGFFALNGSTGVVYTRNGSFRISKTNQLESADGYTLRNVLDQGKPITVDPLQGLAIDKEGNVSQAGQQLGRIQVDRIATAADAIAKLGNNYFALNPGTGPTPASSTEIVQGQLEQSNVSAADSTMRLVNVMRQFEMMQRALNIGSQMNKEAIQDVARVS